MSNNILSAKAGSQLTYGLGFAGVQNSIQGALVCICDKRYNGDAVVAIWNDLLHLNGANDSIVYVVTATRGSNQLTYVGKTLNKLGGRYPAGPLGGLKLVFDLYAQGSAMLDCSLYNCSHPALVELWCYQLLMDRKFKLANLMDPS